MLRLAGIFPSARTCMECGETLDRPLRFDERLEGFVCSTCAGRDAYLIANEVADALDALRLPVRSVQRAGERAAGDPLARRQRPPQFSRPRAEVVRGARERVGSVS